MQHMPHSIFEQCVSSIHLFNANCQLIQFTVCFREVYILQESESQKIVVGSHWVEQSILHFGISQRTSNFSDKS